VSRGDQLVFVSTATCKCYNQHSSAKVVSVLNQQFRNKAFKI